MEQQKGVTHRRRFGRPIWTSEIASNTTNPTFLLPSGYFSARRPDRPWQLLKPKGATSSDDHPIMGAACGMRVLVRVAAWRDPSFPARGDAPKEEKRLEWLEKSDRASPFNNVDV
jgi:hypothetical protein